MHFLRYFTICVLFIVLSSSLRIKWTVTSQYHSLVFLLVITLNSNKNHLYFIKWEYSLRTGKAL